MLVSTIFKYTTPRDWEIRVLRVKATRACVKFTIQCFDTKLT